MWPVLFGSGWVWSVLVAAALLCFIIGGLGFLFLVTGKSSHSSDALDEAWHGYEEGDLTRSEWTRTVARQVARQGVRLR